LAIPPRLYTQQGIDELISCPTVVSEAPRQDMKLDRGHYRNDMRMRSIDGSSEFRMFMRQNADLAESFSVGLVFVPQDGIGEIVHVRCNGPNGGYNAEFDADHPYWDYHFHRASAAMMEEGPRPERAATPCREYASYNEPVLYLLKATNAKAALPHFAKLAQGVLAFVPEEPTA